MQTFPTLSDRAVIAVDGFEVSLAFDPTIEAKAEDGLVLTRQRTARVPKAWKVAYSWLTPEDKAALKDLETAARVGADSFEWVEPVSGETIKVRLMEPIKFSMLGSRFAWRADLALEAV